MIFVKFFFEIFIFSLKNINCLTKVLDEPKCNNQFKQLLVPGVVGCVTVLAIVGSVTGPVADATFFFLSLKLLSLVLIRDDPAFFLLQSEGLLEPGAANSPLLFSFHI